MLHVHRKVLFSKQAQIYISIENGFPPQGSLL